MAMAPASRRREVMFSLLDFSAMLRAVSPDLFTALMFILSVDSKACSICQEKI